MSDGWGETQLPFGLRFLETHLHGTHPHRSTSFNPHQPLREPTEGSVEDEASMGVEGGSTSHESDHEDQVARGTIIPYEKKTPTKTRVLLFVRENNRDANPSMVLVHERRGVSVYKIVKRNRMKSSSNAQNGLQHACNPELAF